MKAELTLQHCSLIEQLSQESSQTLPENFIKVDQILDSLRLSEKEKKNIYKHLVAILHLRNIEFESHDFGTHITDSTKNHVEFATQLLNLYSVDLQDALLFRSIKVPGSKIS